MKNVNLPKKVTLYDKLKQKIRNILGYKEGKKFIIDTKPNMEEYSELRLMRLANVEEKLKKAFEGNKEDKNQGITKQEAEEILKWTVQNARNELAKDRNLQEESLLGCCGFGQAITAQTLRNMGLNPNVCNVNPTIGEDTGRHAFITVNIPIKTSEKIEDKMYQENKAIIEEINNIYNIKIIAICEVMYEKGFKDGVNLMVEIERFKTSGVMPN